jgi:2-oxoglutarate dehydrogenase E1 component
MDRFSFLNAAHTEFFAQLYDQYLDNPDSVEPSWSFFQGFDFENVRGYQRKALPAHLPEPRTMIKFRKTSSKFNVLKLIEGYRTVGICLQNKSVRDRRILSLPLISAILDFHLQI